ncbi:helix-turn-helix domain-containing protein [Actinomadura sp. NPDC049753]|uniref:AraC-like ligand-binding domain-containing protein n=1 Tax=Actinomadura sp. NPDC049753 TaxID=3154739 RepID=UPI0034170668
MKVINTAEVPVAERFAFWREVTAKVWVPCNLRCEPHLESRFQAGLRISEFGPVQASLMTATPYSVERTPKLIRQSDPGILMLVCTVRGHGVMTQDGRRTEFGPGDLVLADTSRPYRAELSPDVPGSQVLVLCLPRSLLPFPQRDLRRLAGVRLRSDQGMGALSSQFLLQLARHLHELGPSDTARLATLTLDVFTAALATALDAPDVVPPQARRRVLMAQIFSFIRRNLGDPQLTPDAIASAHHISLRYLHKLFHQEGHTVAGWIRERRLERCLRDLADPRLADRPINAIAARWGFGSAAHFSQVFRGAYGLSPGQFRRQCAQATGLCAPT